MFIISILDNNSFELIYQYDGNICANFNTFSGKYCTGTKAPQINAEPSATTLTIPFTAFLLFIRFDIKSASVKDENVNKNKFKT